MTLAAKSLTELLEDFRSSAPTPGGGSASALAGAVGASLLAMVSALPKPVAATEPELGELRAAGERSTAAAKRLEALVDRDSEAYELVVAAYKLPRTSDEEKKARSAEIQRALSAAIEAPLDVMRACADAISLGEVVARLGNRSASSDVQVGLELLGAGLRGARLNIEINIGSVKDPEYAAATRAAVAELSSEAERGISRARAARGEAS